MANVKLTFCGSHKSETETHELVAYANDKNELYIHLDADPHSNMYKAFIVLDRETAIKFSKEIRKQISYLESEV